MSDTVSIPVRTYNSIERNIEQNQRMMNRIDIMLKRQELEETVNEKKAAEFMEYDNVRSLQNEVAKGNIPRSSYVILVNGKRRYFLNKLIKR